MTDVDGRTYIDYVGSWGPMILGHADAEVLDALRDALSRGTSYGAPTDWKSGWLRRSLTPCPHRDGGMVSSGTEANHVGSTPGARVTGRDQLVKFEGCYHGHGDSLLVKAGSGVATLGYRQSGVPAALAEKTLTVPFNDEDALDRVFATMRTSPQ